MQTAEAATAVEETTEKKQQCRNSYAAESSSCSTNIQLKNAKATLFTSCFKTSQEHGIDLDLVEGTGANGRITRKDF